MKYNNNLKYYADSNLCELGYDEAGFYTDVLDDLIKDGYSYLTLAMHITWNGYNGYRINEEKEDILLRSTDSIIIPVAVSSGGKVLETVEYNHDKPTGADCYIISLTEREAERVEDMLFNEDYTRINNFVERILRKTKLREA